MDYKEYNDYELVSLAQEGNEDAIDLIYKKYNPIIKSKCRKYLSYLRGVELDDLVLECYIVLYNSILKYNQDSNSTFYTFLNNCLDNFLISEYRRNNNNKSKFFNDSLSLDCFYDDEIGLMDLIEDNSNNPELELSSHLEYNELYNKILDKLTNLEECVFILKIQNFNYKEIASILDKDRKCIDNAIQRIKSKVKEVC